MKVEDIEAVYELSPIQEGMLFHTLYDPQSGVYVEQMVSTLHGALNIDAFERAWQHVLDRHPVLRTSFHWENLKKPLQVVHRDVSLPWEHAAWQGLPADIQDARLRAFLTEDRSRGFDLTQAPLMRLVLFRIATDIHLFVCIHHHLLLDGWSSALMLGEVMACYEAFAHGRELYLPQPRPYEDYIEWLQQQNLEGAEAFWRQTLAGFYAPTPLGVDRPLGSSAQGVRYAWGIIQLPETTTTRLHLLARQHRLTLNTLVQGAWTLLLSRYSGEADVVFGATVAGRPADLAGVETMVGIFINTVPVRVRVRPDAPLLTWLEHLQAQQAEARHYEYSPLVQIQGWSAVPRGQPLFESIVVFESHSVDATGTAPDEHPTLAIRNIRGMGQTNYLLTLVAVPGPQLLLRISYDCRRFDTATIDRMLWHLRTLFDGMTTHPTQRLADLPLLTAAERQGLLVDWNATASAYPHNACVQHLFETQAAHTPDAVALVFDFRDKETGRQADKELTRDQGSGIRDQDSRRTAPNPRPLTPAPWYLTYRELDRRANQLARHLQGMGVGPDMRVGICVERSIEMAVGLLGILKAGGAYVPLDPTYPPERLAFMIQDAQASVLLTQRHLVERLPGIADERRATSDERVTISASPIHNPNAQRAAETRDPAVVCLDSDWHMIARWRNDAPTSRVTPENLVYVIYTSGSTGTPKGVMLNHRGRVNNFFDFNQRFAIGNRDRLLALSSLSFDMCAYDVFGTLAAGGTIVMPEAGSALDPVAWAELIVRHRVTIWHSAPALLKLLVEHIGDRPELHPRFLRLVLLGGDWIPLALPDRLKALAEGVRVISLGGATEASMDSTIYSIDSSDPAWKSIPYGRPMANQHAYLLDAHQRLVPIGAPGELYLGGIGLAYGYFNRPDLTAERFIPNPFAGDQQTSRPADQQTPLSAIGYRLYRTGDLARYLPDGNLELLGRIDHQVKIRGFRIELGEIETVLAQHPAVQEAIVLARGDTASDKQLVAYVVPADDERRKTKDESADSSFVLRPSSFVPELRTFLKEKLPSSMLPAAFVFLAALPLTPNGKVDRRALPAPDMDRSTLDGVFAPPRTPVEEVLAGIWASVLNLDRVGVHDNFSALGGHSLLATRLIVRLRETFQIELPLRTLYEASTVAELSKRIEIARSDTPHLRPRPLISVARDGPLPLSFAQQRLWFLDQLQPNSSAYNMPIAINLIGALAVAVLVRCLNTIIRRHEILRTTIAVQDGYPVQVIAPAHSILLPLIDLQHLAEDTQEALMQRLIVREAERPFDFARGPLLRIALLRLSMDEHILLLATHHIVFDGSIDVFLRELSVLYDAFSAGRAMPLAKLPIQYADYAVWQRQWLQGEVLETQLAYWRTQLGGSLPVLDLPTDRPRSPVQTLRGAVHHFKLRQELFDVLAALSRHEGGTLFMTMLAAFQTLLARYSGQSDILVGSPVTNRPIVETEALIGSFNNTLVLRTDLAGNPPWLELLGRVREVCLGAYAHQDLPFEKLVDAIQPARDLSHNPLFQVMFVLQHVPVAAPESAGLAIHPVGIDKSTARFDLLFSIWAGADGFGGSVEYNTDSFDATTIIRLLMHYQTLLEGIVADPEQRLADLPLLTAAERQQLLVSWNDTALPNPQHRCIQHLFEASLERVPDSIAVVCDRPTTDDQRPTTNNGRSPQSSAFDPQHLTYQALNQQANQLARHLQALGIGPGGLVATYLDRSLTMIPALLGILKAGGAYVPLDPGFPPARIQWILAALEIRCIVTQGAQLKTIHDLQPQLPTLGHVICLDMPLQAPVAALSAHIRIWTGAHLSRLPTENVPARGSSGDLAYIIFTSGSTGTPKGVMVQHHPVVNLIDWVNRTFVVGAADRLLFITSLCFDLSVYDIFGLLAARGSIRVVADQDVRNPERLLRILDEEPITFWDSAPAALQQLIPILPATRTTSCTSPLRLVFLSGDWVPVALPDQIRAAFPGARVISLGGATEATVWSNYYPIGATDPLWVSIPYGKPIPNALYYILDPSLNPCPIGVPGDLYIGGACLSTGYAHEPTLTAEKFIPNPFAARTGGSRTAPPAAALPLPHTGDKRSAEGGLARGEGTRLYATGDRARYWPDGTIEFLGRVDHQVKIRGFRIELGEIEAVLAQHPAVQEAVVLASTDGPGDKRLVAYIVPDQGSGVRGQGSGGRKSRAAAASQPPLPGPRSLANDLRSFLKERLPEYMLPAAFVLLDTLPVTANGKLDRRALPLPDGARPDLEDTFVGPRTPIEEQLTGIWRQVLRIAQVGVHDNFFALGGDSILSIQIIARANQVGIRLTPKQMFQHQTVAALAAVADTTQAIQVDQSLVVGELPLTPIQHWFFEQNLPEPQHFNQARLLEVRRPLDAALLEQVLQHLLMHHDALRLRFIREENGWQQINAGAVALSVLVQIDLTALPSRAQGRVIESVAARAQASLDLANGPLLRVVLFMCGAAMPSRILLTIHHLAVDGVSWQILLEDIQTAYDQLRRGATVRLPSKTTSFKQWAERLTAYAQTDTPEAERAYWLATLRHPVARLPVDYAKGANTVASASELIVSLNSDETRALLQEVPSVYRTQINDVLLTALVQTFADWTGAHTLLVDLEGHGREELFDDVDLSRTVGWFTTLFPVLLDMQQADGPGAVLRAIKEQLRRIPNHGLGYGVLRYLSRNSELVAQAPALAHAEVSFNYWGQVDQAVSKEAFFGPAMESSGPSHSPYGMRSYLIELTSIVAGGQLHLSWTYSTHVHDGATIERLAQGYLAALRTLIAHCRSREASGYTPADFPLTHLDQLTLERLIGNNRQVEDLYPLSPMQQGMLFDTLYEAGSGIYIGQLVYTFQGDMDVAAFQRAWQQVTEQHPVFRSAFLWEGLDEPLQMVYRRIRLPWQVDDWRGLSPEEQSAGLAAFLTNDRRRGFVVSQAPLVRLALFQIAADIYQFIWSQHHLVMDGWSMPIILTAVLAYYNAFRDGRELYLDRPRSYRDYIAWLQQQNHSKAEAFWRQMLAGLRAPTPLGVDRPIGLDTAPASYATRQVQLAESISGTLHTLTRQLGLTLNTVVQGAWGMLLSRYSGRDEVVFGATVAGRPPDLAGVETMVGVFINTVPVRIRVTHDMALLTWLQELQAQQVEARQYEYSPLVQVQSWSEVPRGLPLFESLLIFENYPIRASQSVSDDHPNLAIIDMHAMEQTNYPLTVVAMPGPALVLRISYDRRRFDAATIDQMLRHMQILLEDIAAHPIQPLADLPLLTDAERQQLLVEWNDTTVGVKGQGSEVSKIADACLHELFERQVVRTPDAVAVVYETKDERRRTNGADSSFSLQSPRGYPAFRLQLTYAELEARATKLAQHLRALGAGPETSVGICMDRSLELVVGMLGILKAGGAYVPLDPSYPAERIAFMLRDSQAALLITSNVERPTTNDEETQPEALTDLGLTIHDLRASPAAIQNPNAQRAPEIQNPTPDNLAYIIYTSGSTGRPKGVMISHRAICNHMCWMLHHYPLTAADRILQKTPFSFDASIWEFYAPLLAGAQLVMAQPGGHHDSTYLVRTIAEQQISILQLVPSVLRVLLEEPGIAQCTSLRRVFCGGEALPIDLQKHFFATLDAALYNLYGPTEATIDTTSWSCDHADARQLVPIGRPIANTQLYVLDRHLNPVPLGAPGELYIGGVSLARGYHKRPDLTAERFVPNPFSKGSGIRDQGSGRAEQAPAPRLYRTGDLARYRPDGAIEYLERIDGQVKARGFRIELGEIEAVLGQHRAVQANVVIMREDLPGQQHLVAYVVPHQGPGISDQGSGEPTLDLLTPDPRPLIPDLRAFLATRLPEYMLPAIIIVLEALPLTPNGKVDRRALPAPDQASSQTRPSYVAPRDTLELRLVQIWEDILAIRPIGVTDNFFELGGHSLLVMRLMAHIQQQFGRGLPLATIFEGPAIEQLACLLRQNSAEPPFSPLVPLRQGGSKRPLFLVHPGGGTVFCYIKLVHYLDPDQPVYGLQARGLEEGQEPYARIEDMAAAYIDALRMVQPRGPYLLGGWSLGGTVAFEMAQQLLRQGQEVALLALLDTGVLSLERLGSPDDPASPLAALLDEATLLAELIKEENLPISLADFRRLKPEERLNCAVDAMRQAGVLPPDAEPEQLRRIVQITNINTLAMASYVPQVYPHQITLFKTEAPNAETMPEKKIDAPITDQALGWDRFSTQPVTICSIPGDHLTLVHEPHVRTLAEQLSSCLAALRSTEAVMAHISTPAILSAKETL
jgi:amino acid adenylation domain-containing protein/non-ribosomal peptide synthase protein (TIGR01720 family)